MNERLQSISQKNGVDLELINRIIDLEKSNVYKKKRFISGDLRSLIEEAFGSEQKK